jgi:hypothetical protein
MCGSKGQYLTFYVVSIIWKIIYIFGKLSYIKNIRITYPINLFKNLVKRFKMNKKKILLTVIITTIFISGATLFTSIIIPKTNDAIIRDSPDEPNSLRLANDIPFDYYQEIKIGENYIYNVSSFGADAEWSDFMSSTTDWKTDKDEQIFVNFTGFFEKDPDIPNDTFTDVDMPWINISIFESGGVLNYTNANVSNSEVSRNLRLGFADFQPGFLITVNHTDWIKANATLEANGASGLNSELKIEESYNFLFFEFDENGGYNQKTTLIYDRLTGLLVKANTTVGNYYLEIFLESYELSFEREYIYDIIKFGPPGYVFYYDLWFSYIDTFALRKGSWISINFTGYYHRDPKGEPSEPWPPYDVFYYTTPKRVWMDIKAIYNGDSGPIETMTLDNRSNQEASVAFTLNIGPFVSGFLLPEINNHSFDMRAQAEQASNSIGNSLIYKETDLTIVIDCKHTSSSFFPQDTYLVYEKLTGLLLYVDTSTPNYHLEMEIENYDLPEEKRITIVDDDNDDDEDSKKAQNIPSFPLIFVFSIISTVSLILILKMRKKSGNNKIKFIRINQN